MQPLDRPRGTRARARTSGAPLRQRAELLEADGAVGPSRELAGERRLALILVMLIMHDKRQLGSLVAVCLRSSSPPCPTRCRAVYNVYAISSLDTELSLRHGTRRTLHEASLGHNREYSGAVNAGVLFMLFMKISSICLCC